jgi:aspartate/methionine/tyrosine aminotransferase
VLIPSTAGERFQLSAAKAAEAAHARRDAGLALQPHGHLDSPDELRASTPSCERGGITLIDEIYLGLSYDDTYGHSARWARTSSASTASASTST